ncbi:hypothetical protein LJC30_01300 [Odoribacter sp. OttesenSCG-928-L07]|nr:hypothetical protein [Odoribacter sp. OttesenSCG-928-L07]MDL2239596.1 hypothetical protein [Bacteroidales bacterium OttesenSCG-928-L14]MDL2240758.1 hypothetical protein [Bacteroidales bacterium OttesenSCG-928-K22]
MRGKVLNIFVLLIVLLKYNIILSQNTENDFDYTESFIENLLENNEDSGIIDDIEFSNINYIKINSVLDDYILNIPFLSAFQKEQLILYRKEYGNILSIAELMLIDGFSSEMQDLLLNIIDFTPKEDRQKYKFKDYFKHADYEMIARIGGIYGNETPYISEKPSEKYYGSREKFLYKFLYNFEDRLRISLITEKDAGEQFIDKTNKSLEHLSGFIQWKGKNFSILAGDYYVQFGQGLGVWTGQAFSSGIETISQIKYPSKIKVKTSSDEANYFRGGAAFYNLKAVSIYTYFSSKKADASLDYNDDLGKDIFTSLATMGYHRTANEISKKFNLPIINTGLGIGIDIKRFRLFASCNYAKFEHIFYPKENIENIFKYRNNQYLTYTFDFVTCLRRSVIYGEIAIMNNLSAAAIAGITLHTSSLMEIDINLRYLSPKYTNLFFNNIFRSKNGEYALSIKHIAYINKTFTLYNHIDISKPLWFTTNISTLNPIVKISSKLNLNITRYVLGSIYYRYTLTNIKEPDNKITSFQEQSSHNLRAQIEFSPYPFLNLRSRAEFVFINKSKGILLYQDVSYRFNSKYSITYRISCFDTDDYSTRIYSYENDVLYAYSSPMYYGQGVSMFLLFNYKIKRAISIWGKISFQQAFDRENAGRLGYTLQLIYKL